MNGRPWTRAEIDALVRTIAQSGDTLALSATLRRTPDALIAKARRLQLYSASEPLFRGQSDHRLSGPLHP